MPLKWLRAIAALVLILVSAPATAAVNADPLVSAGWLVERLDQENMKILQVKAGGGFFGFGSADLLPGAVETDYRKDGWRQKDEKGIIDQLPPADQLQDLIGNLGIADDDHVVIVANDNDEYAVGAAARLYWTFKVLGHENLSLVDGGLPAVKAVYSGPWADDKKKIEAVSYRATPHEYLVADRQAVINFWRTGNLIDYRSYEEYIGEKRIRETRKRGTIPNAGNIPVNNLITENGFFRPRDELEALYKRLNLLVDQPHIAFCTTGHRASIGWFVMHEILGHTASRLYDGSLVDWSSNPNYPLEDRREQDR